MLTWNDHGLIPAIAQDATSGTVLMMAWMNERALQRTRATGYLHLWSRSRRTLWKKGETSGHTLRVRELRIDCDADVVLARVDPAGRACHTNRPSCFYRVLADDGTVHEDDGPAGSILDQLGRVLVARRDDADAAASYTRSLLDGGPARMLAKIAEEHAELAAELPDGSPDRIVHETADLWFHVLVALTSRGVAPADVLAELARRFGVSGHDEKAARR